MTQINIAEVKASFTPLTVTTMLDQWDRLHAGDREPLPEEGTLKDAWLLFHNGDYLEAAEVAEGCEQGKSLALKALATYAHYLEADASKKIERFQTVEKFAEEALVIEQDNKANLYYQLAYALGRYGQFISVAKALSEGLAGKIEKALTDCLSLSADHADAHTAFATYKAEIIGKLGKLAAKLTYGANADEAVELYKKGIELAPYSVSAKTEYADGLLSMYGKKKVKDAVALYEQSVENAPIDALEAMDIMLAREELEEA
jgi:tetratricopeptide (TPR) repeat protein